MAQEMTTGPSWVRSRSPITAYITLAPIGTNSSAI